MNFTKKSAHNPYL